MNRADKIKFIKRIATRQVDPHSTFLIRIGYSEEDEYFVNKQLVSKEEYDKRRAQTSSFSNGNTPLVISYGNKFENTL